MVNNHAILAPSACERWFNCPGSALLSTLFRADTKDYAEEGTVAHTVSELKLQGMNYLNEYEYFPGHFNKYFCSEMDYFTDIYVDYIRYLSRKKILESVEIKVDLSPTIPKCFGTVDFHIFDGKTLHIVDLKYGQGIEVSPKDNKQLMLYAAGVLLHYRTTVDEIKLHIVQPRRDNITAHTIGIAELRDFVIKVREAAIKALQPDAKCVAGSYCQMCPVRYRCRELAIKSVKIMTDLNFSDPRLLSDKELATAVETAPLARSWINGILDYALKEAEAGRIPKGFTLVRGRKTRSFINESLAANILRQNGVEGGIEVKLKSVSQIEKLIGKKNFSTLFSSNVTESYQKNRLVPDNPDSRAAEAIRIFNNHLNNKKG